MLKYIRKKKNNLIIKSMKYLINRNIIENKYNPESIMDFLEIKRKYRLYD